MTVELRAHRGCCRPGRAVAVQVAHTLGRRWLPRRCACCRRWLRWHRVRLGLTYCSGRCYARLYQGAPS